MKKGELIEIYGGASWGIWSIIGAALSFAMGLFEGFVNPIKCGK